MKETKTWFEKKLQQYHRDPEFLAHQVLLEFQEYAIRVQRDRQWSRQDFKNNVGFDINELLKSDEPEDLNVLMMMKLLCAGNWDDPDSKFDEIKNNLNPNKDFLEKEVINNHLIQFEYDISTTAKTLGMNISELMKKIKKYNIKIKDK